MSSNTSSAIPSRDGTPNPQNSRFAPQASTAEDLLKSQTVGLVELSDFRKRRAEAIEQKEREGLGRYTPGSRSGAATPSEGAGTPRPVVKKKRPNTSKGKLSFAIEDDEDDNNSSNANGSTPVKAEKGKAFISRDTSETPDTADPTNPPTPEMTAGPSIPDIPQQPVLRKRLGPNASIQVAPKVMTKSALLREAQTREQLRREFLAMQEEVKATEIAIPFVFYDGTNTPGGISTVKKGDHVWLFLDKSRKVGARLGVGGGGRGGEKVINSRREWARVSVDDLMLVRGELIIPHHYDFYYFIVNKVLGSSGTPLFPYSSQPTKPPRSASKSPAPPQQQQSSSFDPLSRPKKSTELTANAIADLEGAGDDPNLTKVVDRRWYERNKHIFPASLWEEFDPAKDYTKEQRRDAKGNAFFFSR